MFWGSRGSKSSLAKAAGAESSAGRSDQKVHIAVMPGTFWKSKGQNTTCSEHFWTLSCSKSACSCGANQIWKSKCPHTIFHTPLCHTSQTIFHTPLCHTLSLSHTICHTPSLSSDPQSLPGSFSIAFDRFSDFGFRCNNGHCAAKKRVKARPSKKNKKRVKKRVRQPPYFNTQRPLQEDTNNCQYFGAILTL